MSKLGLALGLAIGGLALVGAASARADGVWFWGGGGFPYGYNRLVQTDRQIPYFAEFPPVYYNCIVPRCYGQSPYAYWPGPFTPPINAEPVLIDNPYADPEDVTPPADDSGPALKKPVPPKPRAKNTSDRTARAGIAPLVVFNPYVEQPQAVAER